jgi:hypothetical protein
MGRGGKRVSSWSFSSAFKANMHRAAVVAVEVEEVEVMVGLEGDSEIIATTVPATTKSTRRTRSWRGFITACSISQKKRNRTSGLL